MRVIRIRFRGQGNDKGAVAIVVGILLIVFIAVVAIAVDVGYMMVTKNELQDIADGSALAGARMLGRLYECNGNIVTCTAPMPYPDQLTYVADAAAINQAVTDVASSNKAGGMSNISINAADIVIGNWNAATKTVNPITLTSPDAVSVTVRRDASANGPITTFFARIMGINTVNVSAVATAALTGQSTTGEGGLPVPFGISSFFFDHPEYCHDNITFYPSNSPDSCAGWHIYNRDEYNNANDRALRTTINQLDTGAYRSPELGTNTIFKFTGGTMSQQTFDAMRTLYDHNKDSNGNWQVGVPVYQSTDCSNPNGEIVIVGFATAIITSVIGAPTNTIMGTVECDYVDTGRGSGGNYGTKGSIPGLVQ